MVADGNPRLFTRNGDTTLRFEFTDNNGIRKQRKTNFKINGEKRKCMRYAKDYIRKYLEGELSKSTLEQYVEERKFFVWGKCKWIESQARHGKRFSKIMAKSRLGHLNNYILPKFGNVRLDKFTSGKIDDWLVSLPLANQTVNHIRITLRIVFKQAKKDGLISYNPMLEVDRLADDFKERLPFTLEETKILFPRDDDELLRIWKDFYWGSMFCLMTSTGMRSGEVRALRWKHILWNIKWVLIQRAVKKEGVIGMPKNGTDREAPLPPIALDLLQKWHERSQPYDDPDSLIYHGFLDNEIVNPGTICKKFSDGLERSTVEPKGRTAHCLRHTYNTIYKPILSQLMLQSVMGHKDIRMTERYTHVSPMDRIEQFQPMRHLVDELWEK